MSWRLVEEILDVVARPRLRRYRITHADLEDLLAVLTPLLPSVEVDVTLRDPKDSHVVEAALAGGAELIVTGDRDLLDDASLLSWLADRGVEVLRPATAAQRLETV